VARQRAASPLDPDDLARAARILAIRSRREASGTFAGSYASAFRGGGMEFDESRPYVPGDEVRHFDWNALARSGQPFVKRFREERDQMLLLALDVSASMGFAGGGLPKARIAAHTTALLAAAAGRAGDRVGLVGFDDALRVEIPPGRGAAHTWRVIRGAVATAQASRGATDLALPLEAIRAKTRERCVVVLISDFRAASSSSRADSLESPLPPPARAAMRSLARRNEVVSIALSDPREQALPAVGLVRLDDPEHPGRARVLDTSRARVRARYRRAWQLRRRALERELRAAGSDVLWLHTDRDPLRSLAHFFQLRAGRVRGPS